MATLPNPLPRLAADPSGRVLGLQLPAGRLIDTTHDGTWHEPLLWHAEERAVPGGWAGLSAARTAGLLPVLLDVGGPQNGPEDWELMPDEMSYPGDHDAEEVLAEFWEEHAAHEPEPGQDYPGKERVVEVFGEQCGLRRDDRAVRARLAGPGRRDPARRGSGRPRRRDRRRPGAVRLLAEAAPARPGSGAP